MKKLILVTTMVLMSASSFGFYVRDVNPGSLDINRDVGARVLSSTCYFNPFKRSKFKKEIKKEIIEDLKKQCQQQGKSGKISDIEFDKEVEFGYLMGATGYCVSEEVAQYDILGVANCK